jgi:heme-degrading monooxygenase HmoA
MNRFKIRPDAAAEFEEMWRSRESHLSKVPGFREFRLLKGPESQEEGPDGGAPHVLYSSHVIWESRSDFENWTKSEHFRSAHRNAGDASMKDRMLGPPQFEGFETVLHEV